MVGGAGGGGGGAGADGALGARKLMVYLTLLALILPNAPLVAAAPLNVLRATRWYVVDVVIDTRATSVVSDS